MPCVAMVVNSLHHTSLHEVSPTNWEFHLLLYEEVNHKNGTQFKFHSPEVIVCLFVLRLEHQAPVVLRLDNAIHWIKLSLLDNIICFAITYPLDSDLLDSIIHTFYNLAQMEIYPANSVVYPSNNWIQGN